MTSARSAEKYAGLTVRISHVVESCQRLFLEAQGRRKGRGMEPLALRPSEAATMLGIGEKRMRQLIKDGVIHTHPILNTIPIKWLEDFVNGNAEKGREISQDSPKEQHQGDGLRANRRGSRQGRGNKAENRADVDLPANYDGDKFA
jgi:hypothetical protein